MRETELDREGGGSAVKAPSEERIIPMVRASLAKTLFQRGFRVREIARVLKVTQPAVTQYVNGKRGSATLEVSRIEELAAPLADKLAKRIPAGSSVEATELLETARQVAVMSSGRFFTLGETEPQPREHMDLLRGRLRLELDAAEKYLKLANVAPDDYTKLLLRMIAADSIRHGDVVSQLISWFETGGKYGGFVIDESLLKSLLSMEDSASESSLSKGVRVDHPVARLLLRWIDIDEAKHERMVNGLMALSRSRGKKTRALHETTSRSVGQRHKDV